MENRRHCWMRINHNQKIQFLHRCLHVKLTCLRVWSVAPKNHGTCVIWLPEVFLGFQNTVDPTRHRNTCLVHHCLVLPIFGLHCRETTLQPIEVFFPDSSPMRPRARLQAIITGQSICKNTQVSRALNVTVAAEDIRTAARRTHITQSQLQDAVSTCVVVTVGVLSTTHTPNHSTRTIIRQRTCNTLELRSWRSSHTLNFIWSPLGDFSFDVVHAPDTGPDKLFIFPAIFKNVPQDTPDQRDVSAWTETHILVCVSSCSSKAWITNNHWSIVLLFRLHDVLQRHWVCFSRVTTNQENRFRVMNIVVRVRHRTIAPSVRNTGYSG